MQKSILIVGSGKSELVASNANTIFCNSAILRSTNKTDVNVFITDGMLKSNNELLNAKNAIGKTDKESYEIRTSKRNSLLKYEYNDFVVHTSDKIATICKIHKMGIGYKTLVLISRRYGSYILLWFLIKYTKKNKSLLPLYGWTLLGVITGKKVPVKYRPSTGVMAVLYFVKSGSVVEVDGIGNGNQAYYPHKDGSLHIENFNNVHSLVDDLILRSLGEV